MSSPVPVKVEWGELVGFAERCLLAAGSDPKKARTAAEVLVLADARGIASHGLNRLHIYCDELLSGRVNKRAKPKVVIDKGAALLVDGDNGQGIPTAEWAMDLAMERARKHGVGLVSVRNTSHFGIAGYYCMRAARAGMLGMAFTNASPVAVPFRSAKPALGTNPIACAAPNAAQRPLCVDLATTRVPLGRFEAYNTAGENMPSPYWGVDKHGQYNDKPSEVLDGGGPCFLGGDELGGGHKGYALGVMVEMLCGVLSGASAGPDVSHAMNPSAMGKLTPANLGQCFLALDVTRVSPGYDDRMARLSGQLRSLPTGASAKGPVLVPGDPEWAKEDEAKRDGVPLHPNLWKKLNALSEKLKVIRPSPHTKSAKL
eukprot:Hpha_TRINITY_DN16808_c0_g1::TRINITY_DN16808_c0_g1_i1::g.149073::m.149073